MDLYLVSLATGAAGLVAMAVSGLSHAGHAGDGGHAGHDTHAGHAGSGQAGHPGSDHGTHHASTHDSSTGRLLALLSPRVLFALLVGFGAGGLLGAPLGEPWRLGTALLAAAGFEGLLVGPLWRFLFRFESRPAVTLESSIEDEARVVSGFDANGNGLVALDVDGQVVQLLATLSADDRSRGVRVRTGDVVRVDEIDAARGRCIVRATDR